MTRSSGIFKWFWLRRTLQVLVFIAFLAPVLLVGWNLFGQFTAGDDPLPTPATLPFYGSLSSSSVGEISLLDPFGVLQLIAASKTIEPTWLLYALPVVIFYALIRGRAFCGWVCPVNLVLELIDSLRTKLGITVRERVLPRRTKLWVALIIIVLSALTSIPLFEVFSPISTLNKGILFGSVAGLGVLVAIVILELFWGHRVWCRALCPLGGFYEAIGRIGFVQVKHSHGVCIHCDKCKEACLADPAIIEPVLSEENTLIRAGDCMACGSCIDACPTKALSFTLGHRPRA